MLGQLDKLGERIFGELEAKLAGRGADDFGGDAEEHLESDLGDHFRRLLKAAALPDLSLGEKLINQPHADVVAHLLELRVGGVGLLVIFEELRHNRAVRQREELRVELLYSREGGIADPPTHCANEEKASCRANGAESREFRRGQ